MNAGSGNVPGFLGQIFNPMESVSAIWNSGMHVFNSTDVEVM
jgi:hypothetical protein